MKAVKTYVTRPLDLESNGIPKVVYKAVMDLNTDSADAQEVINIFTGVDDELASDGTVGFNSGTFTFNATGRYVFNTSFTVFLPSGTFADKVSSGTASISTPIVRVQSNGNFSNHLIVYEDVITINTVGQTYIPQIENGDATTDGVDPNGGFAIATIVKY